MSTQVVLLTGLPSNFLAQRLLPALLERPETLVKCVVTEIQSAQTRELIDQLCPDAGERVELVRGDATAMDFGMAGTRFLELARSIDVIQHCACSFSGGLSRDLEQRTYLGGTGEVLELSLAGEGRLQRLVHWGSALLSEPHHGRVSEAELTRPTTFRSTGDAARFQAEQLLRDSMARAPVTILRPSIVVGDSRTGESDATGGIHQLIQLMLSSPADLRLPLPGRGDQPLNIVPIDYVIRAGLAIADDPRSRGRTFHLVDPHPLSVTQVFDLLARAAERPGPSGKLSTNLASVLLRTPGLERFSHIPRAFLEQLAPEVSFDTRNTREILAGSGIECPRADSYVAALVDFVRKEHAARTKKKSASQHPHFEEMEDPLDS